MDNWQAILAAITFIIVIVLLMTEWIHLTIVALLGSLFLVFSNILTLTEAVEYIGRSHETLALFLGVMIFVRAFQPTKVFDYLATQMLILAKGNGKFLLLGIVALTTPISALLPNATTVLLLAPLIPPIANDIGVDFIPLLSLMVFTANSAGLLTPFGDPVTFIVSDALNMTFIEYLTRLSLGGLIAIVTVVVMLPWLFPRTWKVQLQTSELSQLPHPTINHPKILLAGGFIATLMLIFFIIGESLPVPVSPAAVALLGATLALLLSHQSKIETVHEILRDVDWITLIFFMCMFVLIGGLEKTGVIRNLIGILNILVGQNILLGSVLLVLVSGFISSLVPNIPLVVGMVPLLKEYVVQTGLGNAEILDPNFTGQLPTVVLPLFYAMLFGSTLGGNGTIVGASANLVAAGVSAQYGYPISFRRFLNYGIPVALCQLLTASLFILGQFL